MAKKIFIADDEEDILKVYTHRLKKKGYEVVVASNGEEALQVIKMEKPDLILLDFRMPKLNGHDACRAIKSDPTLKNIPVILFTASPGGLNEATIKEIKADDVFIKSMEFENLYQKIDHLLMLYSKNKETNK